MSLIRQVEEEFKPVQWSEEKWSGHSSDDNIFKWKISFCKVMSCFTTFVRSETPLFLNQFGK